MKRQSGVVRAADLRAHGLTDWEIRKASTNGGLTWVRQGWYALPGADSPVVEAVRRGGALSCVSALKWHGVWVPPIARSHWRVPRHRLDGKSCHGYGASPPVAAAVDPVLTAFGCAARCLSAESLVVVADSIMNKRLAELADLRGEVSAAPVRVRELLGRCDKRAESGTETMARLRFRSRRIRVRIQVYIAGVGRVDLLIGDRLIIECDSTEHHTSRANYANDRRRDRRAVARGYLVIRLTYEEVLFGWDEVIADIVAIIQRGDHLGAP